MKGSAMVKENSRVLQDCLAKAQNPAKMIEYSKDSIVSKTILDKAAGTITLFAFDKGQKLSEHISPYDAVVHVLDGTVQIMIGGKNHNIVSGEIIIMPANVPHSVTAEDKFKMLLIMIRSKDEK